MFSRRTLLGVVTLAFLTLASSSCSSSSEKHPLLNFKGNDGIVTHVAYSPDGKRIASCHEERPGESESPRLVPSGRPKKFDIRREVKIWDAYTGKEQISLNKGNLTSAI